MGDNGNGHADGAGVVTVADLARRLGVHARTIKRWVERLGVERVHAPQPVGRWAAVAVREPDADRIAQRVHPVSKDNVSTDNRGVVSKDSPAVSKDNGSASLDLVPAGQVLHVLERIAAALERHEPHECCRSATPPPSRASRVLARVQVLAYVAVTAAGLAAVGAAVALAVRTAGGWAQLARILAGG